MRAADVADTDWRKWNDVTVTPWDRAGPARERMAQTWRRADRMSEREWGASIGRSARTALMARPRRCRSKPAPPETVGRDRSCSGRLEPRCHRARHRRILVRMQHKTVWAGRAFGFVWIGPVSA